MHKRKNYANDGGIIKSFLSSISLTTWLIAVNVIVFIVISIALKIDGSIAEDIFLIPANILAGKNLWTLLTHMFMHGGFLHLFANMISLWFIGSILEKIIGRKRFFWFYIISGIFAGLLFSLASGFLGDSLLGSKLFGDPSIAGVGASGAIFGLLGILTIILPGKKIYLISGPLIAIILQSIIGNILLNNSIAQLLITALNIYILISIFSMISNNRSLVKIGLPVEMNLWILPFVAIVPLVILSVFVSLPIANSAHFGGFIAGIIYGMYLRTKYKRKVKLIQKFFK